MIPFEEAVRIVLKEARPVGTERVSLTEASGRVLAEDICSDMDFPPFDKACMDGFACRAEDLGAELKVVETVAAGAVPTRALGPRECARVMTGAMLSPGADTVFTLESSKETAPGRVRFTGRTTPANISWKGEEFRSGEVVLKAGTFVGPPQVTVLASVGAVTALVAVRPRVAIIATGNELVEPSEKPGIGFIRNSNSYQLFAQVLRAGAEPKYYGICRDDPSDIERAFRSAALENDVVLLSGGVSTGDFDFVPRVLRDNGVQVLFDRVAVKPGKPTTFGVGPDCVVFGLPGNPVSTYVIFEVLVRPYLDRIMGRTEETGRIVLPLADDVKRRKTERLEWLPVNLDPSGRVVPVPYRGSANFVALSQATGLISIPVGVDFVEKGTLVHVRPL